MMEQVSLRQRRRSKTVAIVDLNITVVKVVYSLATFKSCVRVSFLHSQVGRFREQPNRVHSKEDFSSCYWQLFCGKHSNSIIVLAKDQLIYVIENSKTQMRVFLSSIWCR